MNCVRFVFALKTDNYDVKII